MRLWTAMLGAWLAAGTGTASAETPTSSQRARQDGGQQARLSAERMAPEPGRMAMPANATPRPPREQDDTGAA